MSDTRPSAGLGAGGALARYPEHQKLSKISDKSNACYEFIQWLGSKHGIVLARYSSAYGDQLQQANRSIAPLLAEFFEIDQKKVDAEKEAMLDEIRGKLPTLPTPAEAG